MTLHPSASAFCRNTRLCVHIGLLAQHDIQDDFEIVQQAFRGVNDMTITADWRGYEVERRRSNKDLMENPKSSQGQNFEIPFLACEQRHVEVGRWEALLGVVRKIR